MRIASFVSTTTKSFNLDFALRKKSSKSPDRKRKKKKNKTNINSHENIKPKFITSEKTQEEIEKEKEWNRKMILNMQYETDSEQEEEFPDDEIDRRIELKKPKFMGDDDIVYEKAKAEKRLKREQRKELLKNNSKMNGK